MVLRHEIIQRPRGLDLATLSCPTEVVFKLDVCQNLLEDLSKQTAGPTPRVLIHRSGGGRGNFHF